MKLFKWFGTACMMALLPSGAMAAFVAGNIVNVDFNDGANGGTGPTATGAAIIGSAADQWNGANGTSSTAALALNNQDGSASGLSLTWTAAQSYNTGGSAAPNLNLQKDFIFAGGSATITGVPAGTYDLYVVSVNDVGGRPSTFTVNGGTAQSTTGVNTDTTYVAGDNYLKFSAISPASGSIAIAFTNAGGTSTFNGFQLTPTPEPASLSLLALGAAGLLARRRRHANR